MEEKELIQETLTSYEKSISFFSNPNKLKRETWVITEFLKNLGIDFQKDELKSTSSDPPDIIFRNAAFEIKEIDEEKRRRHDEYKQKLEIAKSATNLKDLMRPYKFKEITLQEVVNRINRKLEKLTYSPDFCKKTNLLFYTNYSLIGEHGYTIAKKEVWTKWQSVSTVANNNISCVLLVANNAPKFLRLKVGKIVVRS